MAMLVTGGLVGCVIVFVLGEIEIRFQGYKIAKWIDEIFAVLIEVCFGCFYIGVITIFALSEIFDILSYGIYLFFGTVTRLFLNLRKKVS